MNFPGHTLTLIVKGTFDLNHGDTATISEKQFYPTGDEFYPDDDQQQNVRYESDFAYYKPKTDLLLVGKFYPPQETSLATSTATFQVGNKGATHQFSADAEPAGFGPVNKMGPQRSSKLGTYENSWLKERWPWYPLDFNWEYYNAAPKNMQVNNYLRGDEPLICTNLHPKIPSYQTKLPGLRVRCFTDRLASPDQDETEFAEIKMNLDTLWVDMEAEKLVLVWRGVTEVQSEDYDEITGLFIVSEQLDDSPRSIEDCRKDFLAALAAEDAPFEE
ncbi:MAG: DUF2169 domain-containing protein, partial [Candidatus Electrothrix sp. AR4]|nr:DUF2169 domain-containing protein [Candidatus Electrothrix sp. AR4]